MTGKKILIGLLAISGLAVSCKPEDPAAPVSALTVQFEARSGAEELQTGKFYKLNESDSFQVNTLMYYVNNIRLVKADGSETPVSGDKVYLVNHNATSGSAADASLVGRSFSFSGVEPASYTRLKFDIGVPANLDGRSAPSYTTYPSGHSMAEQRGTVWTWDNTYRYVMLMGKARDSKDEVNFSYHLRTTQVYRKADLPISLSLTDNGSATAIISLDVNKIFGEGTGSRVNVMTENATDTKEGDPVQEELAKRIADNMVNAFSAH